MSVTERRYPDWVQAFRRKGTTVKRRGDNYYLYKRTSRRVPGKKYPQPVDTYIGIITPEGVVESKKKKVTITDIEVREYGFSKAVLQLCPEGWKKPLGDDWEDYLKLIISEYSPGSYLLKEGKRIKKEDFHYSYGAQIASLSRRLYKESGVDIKDLMKLNDIYLIYLNNETFVSKISPERKAFLEKYGIHLEEH